MKNKERGFLLVLVNITISLFAVEYYDQYSLALSCEPISFQESFEIMDVIFLGNVISKQYLPSSQNVNVTFSVEEGFKNISEETVFIIVNDEEIWGPVFNKDMQYIVFAYYNDDEDLTIPFCSTPRSFDLSSKNLLCFSLF